MRARTTNTLPVSLSLSQTISRSNSLLLTPSLTKLLFRSLSPTLSSSLSPSPSLYSSLSLSQHTNSLFPTRFSLWQKRTLLSLSFFLSYSLSLFLSLSLSFSLTLSRSFFLSYSLSLLLSLSFSLSYSLSLLLSLSFSLSPFWRENISISFSFVLERSVDLGWRKSFFGVLPPFRLFDFSTFCISDSWERTKDFQRRRRLLTTSIPDDILFYTISDRARKK